VRLALNGARRCADQLAGATRPASPHRSAVAMSDDKSIVPVSDEQAKLLRARELLIVLQLTPLRSRPTPLGQNLC
jgi:hypothetical protein